MIDAAGQDIYGVRRFGKMPEELDAENTEGDDDENFQRNCTLYIRLRQHPVKEADHPWMHLQPKQHDVLAPWIIKIASPILHTAMCGKQDIDAEYCIRASMLYSIALTNWRHHNGEDTTGRRSFVGTAESIRYELFLQQDPHPRGGWRPRLRYDARPWIIMMASSVNHADAQH
jgi:hypothetical protein